MAQTIYHRRKDAVVKQASRRTRSKQQVQCSALIFASLSDAAGQFSPQKVVWRCDGHYAHSDSCQHCVDLRQSLRIVRQFSLCFVSAVQIQSARARGREKSEAVR